VGVEAKTGSKVLDWLDERLQVRVALSFFARKVVPLHRHSIWYYFGGMALFLFSVQVVTGILLLLYYAPTAEGAFESVQFIVTEVRFGWLIRSIHSWAANLMVATVFVHMMSVFLLKAYRKPRELTWVTGVLLFFLTLGFGFSGSLLPWDTLAFFATKVGTGLVNSIPVIGHHLLVIQRGGEDVTGATLKRFFGLHVAVLPLLTVAILLLHLLLILFQGMSVPPSVREQEDRMKKTPFFPNFLLRDLLAWLGAFGLVVGLAVFFPRELGVKADPFAPAPAGIKPEWYFMFMFQTLRLAPSHILFLEGEMVVFLFFGVCGLGLVLVPFLDARSRRGERSPLFTAAGVLMIVYIVTMTIVGYLVEVG
jgi:cytochrome b6